MGARSKYVAPPCRDGGLLTTYSDITRHRLTERALQQSETRFRDLLETSPNGCFVHRNWRFVFANQALAQLLGYDSRDELIGAALDAIIAPEDVPRLWGYAEARTSGQDSPPEYEFDALRKDGSRVRVQQLVRLTSWEGEAAYYASVVDISRPENRRTSAARC